MPWTPDMPYPEREHLETPASVTERIYDELKYAGTGSADIRNALGIELHEIYKDTSLTGYLDFYAGALVKAEKLKTSTTSDFNQSEDDKYRPAIIYSGSLLAVRTVLNGLPYDLHKSILHFSSLSAMIRDVQSLAPVGLQTIEQMIELTESIDEMMGNFPEELQYAIMVAAEQCCQGGDPAIARQRERDFILGFLAATNVTANIRDFLAQYPE